MADLYKGIAGSPITYLTADISANQTTISIADDSALPDAPNICTIGYGENLETIKYGVKSNGVLQNVTRGIEGTPRAWPAGTEVARFFTAYDHNEIIDGIVGVDSDLETHLAESASKHITESGSNENGRYIKFDDGTMICTMRVTITTSITNALSTGGYRSGGFNKLFPATFYSEPVVISSTESLTAISSSSYPRTNYETTMFTSLVKSINSVSEPADYTIYTVAIGRWK